MLRRAGWFVVWRTLFPLSSWGVKQTTPYTLAVDQLRSGILRIHHVRNQPTNSSRYHQGGVLAHNQDTMIGGRHISMLAPGLGPHAASQRSTRLLRSERVSLSLPPPAYSGDELRNDWFVPCLPQACACRNTNKTNVMTAWKLEIQGCPFPK